MNPDILLDCALPGTDRAPGLPTFEGGGSVAHFLAQVSRAQQPPALKLLRSAAILGVCGRAGFEPPLRDVPPLADTGAEPEPAARAALLEQVLEQPTQRLVHEALSRMAAAKLCIPTPLLRQALDLGAKTAALRDAVTRVLGARGRWLALQDASWSYARSAADGDDAAKWNFGSLQQRTDVLQRQRQCAPDAARARLLDGIKQQPPGERAVLLGTLRVNLSLRDEPDLQKLLSDRKHEPRRVVVGLLASLPQSAFAQRMQFRLATLLKKKKGLFGGSWEIDPPERFEEGWKSDGLLSEKPAGQPLGERAWWLLQLVASTRPAWWCEHTGLPPDKLVRWAAQGLWADSLIGGWLQALEVMDAPGWPQALLRHAREQDQRRARDMLMQRISASEQDAAWLRQLASDGAISVAQSVLDCPTGQSVSAALSKALVAGLLGEYAQEKNAWYTHLILPHTLPEIVCVLDPGALGPLQNLPVPEGAGASIQKALRQTQTNIQIRLAFPAWIATAPDSTPPEHTAP
ncbi:hypothetical protein D8B23_02510 [Verminephrobacter aporrectodeae subsp. tuberculatae]|uniref:DUF5691 domain-containing protein n=3 Tax=Verminephrobacter aporrectodeae TaxID=1110389 RepID=UPI002243961D|nr:DUF5691 domain-containing protein [Verminephrobacter aporrectodeae]MCW8197316.1 hypothetical protein [Verminephrobacter aporrectodeae subsp. tuberculatae]